MNKKAFLIIPIIFIIFVLIAAIFSFYVSNIDNDIALGIQKVAAIEKGIMDIQQQQINQYNFAKISAYLCTKKNCYNATNASSIALLKNCMESYLNDTYGNNNYWNVAVNNTSQILQFNMSNFSFSATDINIKSVRDYKSLSLHDMFFIKCKG